MGNAAMREKELISKIDFTLHRLSENAGAFEVADLEDLMEEEVEAFEKTQESLLNHLLEIDSSLQNMRSPPLRNTPIAEAIRERSMRIQTARRDFDQAMQRAAKRRPLFSKRRFKRRLEIDLLPN